MMHATWNAIKAILRSDAPSEHDADPIASQRGIYLTACDWEWRSGDVGWFVYVYAEMLVEGANVAYPMPSCPTCAMFVEMALVIRDETVAR